MRAGLPVDRKLRLLAGLPRPGGNFLSLTSLARLFEVAIASARVIARRYADKGVLRRVGPRLYANFMAAPGREQLAVLLRAPAYLSAEWALGFHGASTQIAADPVCVTLRRPGLVATPWGPIRYHALGRARFFGFRKERLPDGVEVWVAEPEKALLDWLYLSLRRGEPAELGELRWSRLDRERLRRYALSFPLALRRRLGSS